jgi:hypothetical protein
MKLLRRFDGRLLEDGKQKLEAILDVCAAVGGLEKIQTKVVNQITHQHV